MFPSDDNVDSRLIKVLYLSFQCFLSQVINLIGFGQNKTSAEINTIIFFIKSSNPQSNNCEKFYQVM